MIKLEKLESNNDQHKRIDKERWCQERKMEEQIEDNHNNLIDDKNEDVVHINNELQWEEYEEQEAATPNEPETEHEDASTPSREMCSKNSYHNTINKIKEEHKDDNKNVLLPINHFMQSQQMLHEKEEEESTEELHKEHKLAKVSCNVLSVFNQSPYISPHSLEYNSESHQSTDYGVNDNHDCCDSNARQNENDNNVESKCSQIGANNTATATKTKATSANINGSTSNQSQLHEIEEFPIEELEEYNHNDNNHNNNNNDMVDTAKAVSKEELQATQEIEEKQENSICLSHPVVEFLSSIHLQGFAHSIIEEHQIYSLEQLSSYMSAEVNARELLGERSSMHQRRELWKGVEQLRRNWEKVTLCKQQAAKKKLDKETKQRKMSEIQARRRSTKVEKLCKSQSNVDKKSNAETNIVVTTANTVPISDNDTLDVICNRLLSSQKKERVENVEMGQEHSQQNVEETENSNAKKTNSKTTDVAAFMSEMKFKRSSRTRKLRSARNSKSEQQRHCRHSNDVDTKGNNNNVTESNTLNNNSNDDNNQHNNISNTNNKCEDYADETEEVEAVLEAAIAEASIYEKETKSVTLKLESDHDVIVISDSDDDNDNNDIDSNGDGCDFVKLEKQMSDTKHEWSDNVDKESNTVVLCEGINTIEKKASCLTNEYQYEKHEEELEEECSESQKELMEQINALLLEYNNKHKTRNDSSTECLHGSELYSLRAVLHPFHENSSNEQTQLVSLCTENIEGNEGNQGTITYSSECEKTNQEHEGTASSTHNCEDDDREFVCDNNNPGRGSSGSNMLELFGLEALEPTQLINEEYNKTVIEEAEVCHSQDYNNDDNNECYYAESFELTQCISPINACDESHNDDASLPTSPLSQLLDLSHLQYSTNYPESYLYENETELEHEQEQQRNKQKGDVCVDDVINAHGQSDHCNIKYENSHEEEEEKEEEFSEEIMLHWVESPHVIRNMSTTELVNQYNQLVKSSSKIEIDETLELSLEQREELEETLKLQSVQKAFARMVAPAMLHRSKRISQLEYKRLRTADYTRLVLQKMKCTEKENNIDYNHESSRQDLDNVLLKQKICEEEFNEVGKCVFAALATETVKKLENTHNCNVTDICSNNTNFNDVNKYRQSKCELTSLEKILLLEPVEFDQVMSCVQQHNFSFVPQLKLRRLLDESGVSLSTAVGLSQRSDLPLQSSQPLEVHEQKEQQQQQQQEEELHHDDAHENSQRMKKVKRTSSQVYFARRQHHSYYHPTTRVAGRRAIRTKRKRQESK